MHETAEFKMASPKILTFSGALIDPVLPEPELINIADIAQGLALANRYCGQCNYPYSVAQHSVALSKAVPPYMKRYALMHDASEAFLGDKIRPVKRLLPDYIALEKVYSDAVYKRFDVLQFQEMYEFDFRLTANEIEAAMPHNTYAKEAGIEPLDIQPILIQEMSWDQARRNFVYEFIYLFPEFKEEGEWAIELFNQRDRIGK